MNHYLKECLAYCYEWLVGGSGEIYRDTLSYCYCRDINIAHEAMGRSDSVYYEFYHLEMTNDGFLRVSNTISEGSILTANVNNLDEFRRLISYLCNMSYDQDWVRCIQETVGHIEEHYCV